MEHRSNWPVKGRTEVMLFFILKGLLKGSKDLDFDLQNDEVILCSNCL